MTKYNMVTLKRNGKDIVLYIKDNEWPNIPESFDFISDVEVFETITKFKQESIPE